MSLGEKDKLPFDTAKDIPSQKDRVIFLTSGTAGLGRATLLALAHHQPAGIYFTGRNAKAASDLITEIQGINPAINAVFLQCDQSSLASVHAAAKQFLSSSSRLDILICNAGVMGKDPALTTDNIELQFGINHLAHALLIKLLLPALSHTITLDQQNDPRIVLLTSVGFRWTPAGGIIFPELTTTQDYWFAGPWVRYGQSKLANVLYAQQLAARYPGIKTVSIHPGVIATGLYEDKKPLSLLNRVLVKAALWGKWVSLDEGIKNTCWVATTEAGKLDNGAFYEWTGVKGELSADAMRRDLADELWTWTQEQLERFEA